MITPQVPSFKSPIFLSVVGIIVVSSVFAGCKAKTAVVPDSNTAVNEQGSSMKRIPYASPATKAVTASQAETDEKVQLDVLSKDSTSIDQGLNDQAIPVN